MGHFESVECQPVKSRDVVSRMTKSDAKSSNCWRAYYVFRTSVRPNRRETGADDVVRATGGGRGGRTLRNLNSGCFCGGAGLPANLLGRPHGFQHTRNYLPCPSPTHLVGRFGLEQLRVRQNDSQLIVQPMKEGTECRRFIHESFRQERRDGGWARSPTPACDPPADETPLSRDDRCGADRARASRQKSEPNPQLSERIRSFPTTASCRPSGGSRRPVRTPS